MTPEGRLLRSLLQVLGGGIPLLPLPTPDEINWEDFRARAKRHRLGPLFSRKLPKTLDLPGQVLAEWNEETQRELARTVLRGGCLRALLEAFALRGIESIVLKGDHLAEVYYPHPSLRPADDLDLLIRPQDADAAEEILDRSGGIIQEKTTTAEKYLFPETGVFIELHTDLQTAERRNPAFAIRIEDFWRGSVPARIAGGETRVLSPTLNLLYLAAHLSHHSFSRLIWFYDLFLVIEKSGAEIDWDQLAAWSRGYRCAGQVYYPLLLTGFFFGKTIPRDVLRQLAPARAKQMLTRLFINPDRVVEGKTQETGTTALLNRFLLNDCWPRAMIKFF